MKTYDVIIIGAGPAGVMAARELEKNNVNYLVMEAKAKIGIPLRCGEITR
jgi:digeranylgeranylglycerophospholipid reductase